MNFMIQECIEKQIKINMNEEIKKELLKYILYILILNYIIILFIFFLLIPNFKTEVVKFSSPSFINT